jgi:putative addiction module killer protein
VVFVVHEYLDETGKSPFRAWLETLDKSTRARVQARILRFETGNLGDHKELGSGVWEARLAFGAGYRVYFGRRGRELILLLFGGDKGSQARDIRRAKDFWASYMKGLRHGKTK